MVMPNWAFLVLGLVLGAIPTRWYYQAEMAEQATNVANGMTAMSEAYRAETERAQASVETIRVQARENEETVRIDSFAAGSAAERLHKAGKDTGARCNASAPARSEATEAPGDLLADVLARLDEAAGQLATAADERGNAGTTCWQTLEALKNPSK